ncbi:adenylate/guanylate cyclase domain-containing protein [Marivibrio halodurans]|uniref:Adenylate/guanylate cyclase domain-containing protein n=1 Tax=Marivibrio halodurans TaxID=2039722 RepID=A0A8J7RZT4_9PROT|nr:adenylate/guanylate cyclase domain-containing protein [Marivibrio halodurans]MBP5856078.1 adenylate/guanylate cyclase domain-containing protein [Marivibrio halodurans]
MPWPRRPQGRPSGTRQGVPPRHYVPQTGWTTSHFAVLGGAAVLTVALCFLIVAGLFWRTGSENTRQLLREDAARQLTILENTLDGHFRRAHFLAGSLARGAIGDIGETTADTARTILITAVSSTQGITDVAYLAPDMRERRARIEKNGAVRYLLRDRSDAAGFKQFTANLKEATGTVWRGPYLSETAGTANFEVWHPVHRRGAFVGAWGVAISLAEVSRSLVRFKRATGTTPFLLRGRYQVLAHPSLSEPAPTQAHGSPLLSIDALADPVLPYLWASGERIFGDETPNDRGGDRRAVAREVTLERFDGDTTHHLALYRWNDTLGPSPWVAGLWFEADIYSRFDTATLRALGIGLGVTLIACLLLLGKIWYFGTRPVERVAGAARGLADRRFETDAPLPPSHIAIFDQLSHAFARINRAQRLIETYVPRKLIRDLVRSERDASPVLEDDIAVMFTDIVGFSRMSEGMSSREISRTLNEHFALLGRAVEETGGTIDKYIGDALMAFWGAPERVENAAEAACRSALRIAEVLEASNRERANAGKPTITVRIGIHIGPAIVGDIGAENRVNYTVVGDCVNVCSRLENLASDIIAKGAATTLVSEAVRHDLPDGFECKEVGTASIKGRRGNIKVFLLRSGLSGRTGPAGEFDEERQRSDRTDDKATPRREM